MIKFKTKKEQLKSAHLLLTKFSEANTGGISPAIKQMIILGYLNKIK